MRELRKLLESCLKKLPIFSIRKLESGLYNHIENLYYTIQRFDCKSREKKIRQ